jgi:hypothetical protein
MALFLWNHHTYVVVIQCLPRISIWATAANAELSAGISIGFLTVQVQKRNLFAASTLGKGSFLNPWTSFREWEQRTFTRNRTAPDWGVVVGVGSVGVIVAMGANAKLHLHEALSLLPSGSSSLSSHFCLWSPAAMLGLATRSPKMLCSILDKSFRIPTRKCSRAGIMEGTTAAPGMEWRVKTVRWSSLT